MKVHVVGFYDRFNVGDEAFRPAIADMFSGHDVSFYDIDMYRGNLPPAPDVVVLGGGDVVTPYYLPVISAIKTKKIGLGVGLGYESESNLAAQAGFDAWFLRNKEDVALVKAKTSIPVEYTPDLAFHLKPSGNKVLQRYYDGKQPVVAVLLTDYLMPSGTRTDEKVWDRTRSFLEEFGPFCIQMSMEGYKVVAVPCSTDQHADDRRVALSVRAFADHNMICVNDYLPPQDMIDLLADVKYAVCQRFHSHVFSMIAGKPILSVGFTRKVKKLLTSAGAGVDANCFNDNRFVETDFMAAFAKMKKEANTTSVRFLKFAEANRTALEGVKQKVSQLTTG